MKILHTADVHLRGYEDPRWEALKGLIEIGKKEKIDVMAISGDLFDRDVNAEELRPKIRKIFSKNGFKIVLIPGNHDSDSYSDGKFFGKDTVVLDDTFTPLEFEDAMMFGMPFEPIEGGRILDKFQKISSMLKPEKTNILLFHGELLDSFFSRRDFGEEGEGRYMPVKLSYFGDLNVDYVLAGHFHSKFDYWQFKNGGYFVYPGSPISITKKETGPRAVNLFELGQPPEEYPVETPHYEEVSIFLDLEEKNPIGIVESQVNSLSPQACGILTVSGFVNMKAIGMDEAELYKKIEEIAKSANCEDLSLEFRDIGTIIEDDLFKSFDEKLKKSEFREEEKNRMREIAIRAMGMAI